MADVMLPGVSKGKNDSETVQMLYDAYYKLRRELEFLLENLDQGNMNKTFDGYIKKLAAGTIVANTIITKTLYADLGTIADLTVNSLSTANIIKGDDVMHYIDVQGQYIVFKKAVKDTTQSQIQLTNKNEENLYWEDATQKIMSTTVTSYPVMVYQYNVYDKLKIYYDTNETVDYPVMIWGTGNGVMHGDFYEQQAIVYKDGDGFTIKYIQDGGDEISFALGESGVLVNGSQISAVARFL